MVISYKRNRAAAEAVAARLTEQGGDGIAIRADVTSEAETHALIWETTKLGKIDVPVNNAAPKKLRLSVAATSAVSPDSARDLDRDSDGDADAVMVTCVGTHSVAESARDASRGCRRRSKPRPDYERFSNSAGLLPRHQRQRPNRRRPPGPRFCSTCVTALTLRLDHRAIRNGVSGAGQSSPCTDRYYRTERGVFVSLLPRQFDWEYLLSNSDKQGACQSAIFTGERCVIGLILSAK